MTTEIAMKRNTYLANLHITSSRLDVLVWFSASIYLVYIMKM